jgi:metallo-beta-lactamase family protein
MKLTFWGAARQVTGSMYLLELEDDFKILIDCGTDMDRQKGKKEKLLQPYSLFPFEPSEINVVLLTHAHIDHSGNLPNLIREGYEGQILCTSATLPLTHLLLQDSAALNQKLLKHIHSDGSRKKSRSGKKTKINPSELYLEKQVNETVDQFVTVAFNHKFRIKKGLDVTFIPTGHLLGAANILIEVEENGEKKRIGFSGDIGRNNYPLLQDPQRFPEVDYLICETTYGNRRHQAKGTPEEELATIIKEACIDIPGRLIIPAFSVGRTQALLYTLNKLYTTQGFPPIKVFSDSPLALQSTKVYEKYTKQLNVEAQEFYEENEGLFDFQNLVYVENMKESRAIASHSEPCIIISSSGMVQGGRVEHHVMTNINNPYATILMIGYAAEGTLGRKLLDGMRSIRLANGNEIPVLANIRRTDVFSGHGDLDDLTRFVKYQSPEKLKKIFLIHGEYKSMTDFHAHLIGEGYNQVEIPQWGQSYTL